MKTKWLVLIGICLIVVGFYMNQPTTIQTYEVVAGEKGLKEQQLKELGKTKYIKSFSVHKTGEQVYTVHIHGGIKLKENYELELKEVKEMKGGYHIIVEEKVKGELSIHPYKIAFPTLQINLFTELLKEPNVVVETIDGDVYRNINDIKEEQTNIHITSGFFKGSDETFATFNIAEGDLRQKEMEIQMDEIAKNKIKTLKEGEKYFVTYYLDKNSNPWILNVEKMDEGYVKNGVIKEVSREEKQIKVNVSGLLTYGDMNFELDEKVLKQEDVELKVDKSIIYVYETNGKHEIVQYIWDKK